MAKSEISATSFCSQRKSWNVKAVLWKYIVCVWPSITSQGLFECLGMLTQPWITVYSRDITKGTDLAVERGWSLPSLNLHFRNRMISYTQKYCNSSWKLLGVTSHLFKVKDCWFPHRASWISLGIQTIDDVNTRNCLFTFIMLAANLTAERQPRELRAACLGSSSLPAEIPFWPRNPNFSSTAIASVSCLASCLGWMKGWRVEDPLKVLNLSLCVKDLCWV